MDKKTMIKTEPASGAKDLIFAGYGSLPEREQAFPQPEKPFVARTKIIAFPGVLLIESLPNAARRSGDLVFPETMNPLPWDKPRRVDKNPILARPGETLPESIPDFRDQLQRDGLILLSWDKRSCEKGTLYTAYWVTSSGILRYYASPALPKEYFVNAMPNRKSYAAEDGIDFYGEASPDYIVHVAPELMMSCNEKQARRPEHIKRLKSLGIEVDFDYPFLLTTERKKRLPGPDQGDKRGA